MMKYVLLLRGINVGGKNKVKMDELKQHLSDLGFTEIASYINSGNLVFNSEKETEGVKESIREMLAEKYGFEILFALATAEEYKKTVESLPDWWKSGKLARRDVLFFTDGVTEAVVMECIGKMSLYNEIICSSGIAVFWGKIDEKEYAKTAYHKYLLAEDFYKKVTIRNGNTVQKILALL